jgi:hypothetical protein
VEREGYVMGKELEEAINDIRLMNATGKYDYDDIENDLDYIYNYFLKLKHQMKDLEVKANFWMNIHKRKKFNGGKQ